MIYQLIHIDPQIIRTVLTGTEVVERRICLIGTKNDPTRISRDNGHLHLKDEITEISSKSKTSMEIPVERLTSLISPAAECTGSVILICSRHPANVLVVVL